MDKDIMENDVEEWNFYVQIHLCDNLILINIFYSVHCPFNVHAAEITEVKSIF